MVKISHIYPIRPKKTESMGYLLGYKIHCYPWEQGSISQPWLAGKIIELNGGIFQPCSVKPEGHFYEFFFKVTSTIWGIWLRLKMLYRTPKSHVFLSVPIDIVWVSPWTNPMWLTQVCGLCLFLHLWRKRMRFKCCTSGVEHGNQSW